MPGSFAVTTADAIGQLDGPGTSAYAVDDDYGFHSTSYAYENGYGAIYERNTFEGTFLNGVTEYRVGFYERSGGGTDGYAASQTYTVDGYSSHSLDDPYGDHGPHGYGDASGKATQTTYVARYASYSGGVEQVSMAEQSSVDYRDGAHLDTSSSLTEAFSGGGLVAGSYTLDTSSAYTAYGSGYTSDASSETLR